MSKKKKTVLKTAIAVLSMICFAGSAFAETKAAITKADGIFIVNTTDASIDNFDKSIFYKNDCNTAADITAYDCIPSLTGDGMQHPDIISAKAESANAAYMGFVFPEILKSDKFSVSFDACPLQTNAEINMGFNTWFANAAQGDPQSCSVYFGADGKMGYAPQGAYHTGNPLSERSYTAATWYHFDALYDLDERMITYYLDGQLWGTTGIYKTVLKSGVKSVYAAIDENNSGAEILLDNVRIVPSGNVKVKYSTSGNLITAEFSQPMNFQNIPEISIINTVNGDKIAVQNCEQRDAFTLDIYCSDSFKASAGAHYRLMYSEQPTSFLGNSLTETYADFSSERIAAQVYAAGKSPADLTAGDKNALVWQNQTLSELDGSASFMLSLPNTDGEYTMYISQKNDESPFSTILYNKQAEFSSDFDGYTGGAPSDWTFVSGGSFNLTAEPNGDETMLKINTASSELKLFKRLDIAEPIGSYRVSMKVRNDSVAALRLKLMNEYKTSVTGNDVFDLIYMGEDGYIGYSINQTTDGYSSANNKKYYRSLSCNLEIWLDFDMRRITYAVDGKILGRSNMNDSLLSMGGIALVAEKGASGSAVYVDHVTIEKTPREYAAFLYSQGETPVKDIGCETSFAIKSEKCGNVFAAENPSFVIDAYNRTESGSKALITYVKENGSVIWENETDITLQKGANRIPVTLPFNKFGIFTFEVQIDDNIEEVNFSIINSAQNMKKNKMLGINEHVSPEYGDAEKMAGLDIGAGFGIIRSGLRWADYGRSDGSYVSPDWYKSFDRILKENRVEQLFTLGYSCPQMGIFDVPKTDAELEAFAEYAQEAVSEFGADGIYYEIWNEYPLTSDESINSYLKMMQYIYPAVKRANPNAKVVGVAAAHTDFSGIEKLIQLGGKDYMDILSIHQYCDSNSPELGGMLAEAVQGVRDIMDENGMESCELWMSEYGWTVSNVSELQQAQYLVRTAAINSNKKIVDRLICYNGVRKQAYQNSRTQGYEYGYGILQAPNTDVPYAATPAYAAMSNFNTLTADAQPLEYKSEGGIENYSFTTFGGDLNILYTLNGEKVYSLSEGEKALDIYGNIIAESGNVNIGDSPVYIVKNYITAEIKHGEETITDYSQLQIGDVISVEVSIDESVFAENDFLDVYAACISDGVITNVGTVKANKSNSQNPVSMIYNGGKIKLFVWNHGSMTPASAVTEIFK